MNFNIKNVKGDVTVSENQSGGVTGKSSYKYSFFVKHKKSIIISVFMFVAALVTFISNLATVLNFFNVKF